MEKSDPTRARLERALRENAARYYPALVGGDLRVSCLGARLGALSRVYRFRIVSGNVQRGLVVKLPPVLREAGGARVERPRVAPLPDPATKYRSEHATLQAIERHFEALGDPRFTWVRALDFLADDEAVVMQEIQGRPLTSLVARANRLLRPRGCRGLEAVFERTGAWLRAYHALPALPHTRPRSATREEFRESVRRLADFLASAHPPGRALLAAAARAEAAASAWLPARLPLATGHGDLAPRNVIVDENGRVVALDTRAAWRAPIYEDLGYFLTAFKTPRAQARSLGLAFGRSALGRLETAFLRGYFAGDPIPLERIRLFELQCLLDKWASSTQVRERGVGLGRVAGAYRDWSADRLFDRSLASVLARLGSPEVAA